VRYLRIAVRLVQKQNNVRICQHNSDVYKLKESPGFQNGILRSLIIRTFLPRAATLFTDHNQAQKSMMRKLIAWIKPARDEHVVVGHDGALVAASFVVTKNLGGMQVKQGN
jgi:hypothetical protein